MVVGEAPGEEEDKRAIPFIGPAGRLLDKMLAAIGHDRKNTYITNVVFWRPPGNRQPTDDEISICYPFLKRHILLVNPKVILLTGTVAAKTLLKTSKGITQIRGQWNDLSLEIGHPAIKTMATFHPSFLLRQPLRKREAWEDLQNIQKEIAKYNF